ncbi:MAG TPA: hypothetical protein VMB49_08250 [Acidobacteriaceae bacterium]|nr:hypothetical protein [Acidobacteriaceae bacterium]
MKNRVVTQVLALSAALLLLCLAFPVNSHAVVPSSSRTVSMDGVPLPPPVKQVTDGVPLPPPVKQFASSVTDGVPLPPPVKQITDGVPLPPPVKQLTDGVPLPPPVKQ